MAGIVGIEPGPLTLRQLVWMAEARTRADWARTSALLAMVANVHRDPKKTRAFKPSDFDPLASRNQSAGKADVSVLKQVFVDRKR